MSTNTGNVLRNDAFEAFLDDVEAVGQGETTQANLAHDDGDDDGADDDGHFDLSLEQLALAKASARALLASQQLEPGDMDALGRLFRIWMWLDDPTQALAAIDAHGPRLENDLSHAERLVAARIRAMLRVVAMKAAALPREQLAAAIHTAADAVSANMALPSQDPDELIGAWDHLRQCAAQAKLPEVLERCARELHAVHIQQPQRKAWRAHDDAALQLRLSEAAELQGDTQRAQQLARKALQTLSQPGPDQSVDTDDWLHLSPPIVRLVPDALDLVKQRAQLTLGPHASPAIQRDLAVRLARITAHALWAQGDPSGALAAAREGRFLITNDDNQFTVHVMDWLLQTGQADHAAELAKLALEACWHQREPANRRAIDLGKQQLQSETDHAGLWTLALAAAAHEVDLDADDVRELGYDTLEAAQLGLLSRARALNPNHPAVDVLEALTLERQKKYAQALPKFERLLDAPELANQSIATALWLTRMRVLGVAQAMNQRFLEAGSGNWCYALGVTFSDEDDIMERLALNPAQRASFPTDALHALGTRYYERAMLRFEAFFATGEGNVRDADIHTYSMNCNNLAIRYRYDDEQYENALSLHQKGLGASPFAEHKLGAMWCLYHLDRHAEFVESAEQLWHYAIEHGFGRHDPNAYFHHVAWALQFVNRGHEIEIWLDRLRQWRSTLDDEARAQDAPYQLGCEAGMLDYLYPSKPEDALARMRAIRPELMRTGRSWGIRRLADGLLNAKQAQEALETYERAVAAHLPDQDEAVTLERAREGVEKARTAIRAQKPFWRRWL